VSQANEELENIIQQVLEEETVHQTVENKARLPRRLIVSNIAADAGEEDLREFFYSFRFAMYVTTIPLIDEPTC
jgi:MoxR-like ATPase